MMSCVLLLPPWSLLSLRQFSWSPFHMDANVIFLCTCGLTNWRGSYCWPASILKHSAGYWLGRLCGCSGGTSLGGLGLGTLIGGVCVCVKTMDALWEGSHRDRIVGGRKQGGGQGLAKRSHLISQGSPFAPPPIHLSSHPPSLSFSHCLSLPANSWKQRRWSHSAQTHRRVFGSSLRMFWRLIRVACCSIFPDCPKCLLFSGKLSRVVILSSPSRPVLGRWLAFPLRWAALVVLDDCAQYCRAGFWWTNHFSVSCSGIFM